MKHNRDVFSITAVKIVLFFGLASYLFLSSCTALQEAQQRRQERVLEKRKDDYVMLAPSKSEKKIDNDGRKAESDHYTVTFAQDLKDHENFDETVERREFLESALGYMESLYDELYAIFGFQPEHKIHVTFHDVYNGSRNVATTTTQYRRERRAGTSLKFVTGIGMDFPLAMYEKPDVRVHELTHAFTNIYFLPTWFNEGLAVLMQMEWAKGRSHPKFNSLEENLKVNLDDINDLEDWTSHQGGSQWRYRYAYSIVSELRSRYGDDLYIKVFQLMEADQLHNKLPSTMPVSFLVYYLNQASGANLVPFFEKLKFKVQPLTKAEILQKISQQTR